MSINLMHKAHIATRCRAMSKRTGLPCPAPAVGGHHVYRMHVARGGAPSGKQNGNDRHGARTDEAINGVRKSNALLRLIRQSALAEQWRSFDLGIVGACSIFLTRSASRSGSGCAEVGVLPSAPARLPLEGPRAPVLAVEIEQVERVEDHLASDARLCSRSKIARPALVAPHRLRRSWRRPSAAPPRPP